MAKVVEESLQYALTEYGVDIKINNLDNILDKLGSLVTILIFEESLGIIWFIDVEFQICAFPPEEGYFINFVFEPYEDIYNYERTDISPCDNSVVVLIALSNDPEIDKNEYSLQVKNLENILEQLQINVGKNFDNLESGDPKHFRFSLPLGAEITRFLI